MLNNIKRFFVHVFTEPNNSTVCVVRVFGVGAVVQALGLQAYAVVAQHAAFDLQAFGVGMGTLLGALGVALGLKKDSQ